jgi:hypothetical protein
MMIWKRHWIHVSCILSIILFLGACGDGGDGGSPQAPAEIKVSALLTRSQENPAFTNFSSSGAGSITVDPASGKISGVVVTNGVLGTAAHIHSGAPGVAGPVEIPLTGGPSVWSVPDGTILTPDQLAMLNAGQLYFNIHSAKAPAGEIRGQLTQLVRFASLTGADETPPISTTASGSGVLALNPANGQISGFVRTSGVVVSDAHIHLGATGVAGPVIVPLTETTPSSGIWAVPAGATLTADQIAAFNANELYYNIHSAAFPAGEIRGQILSAALNVKTAQLNGTQEVPSVLTTASGTGIAVVNSVTREVFSDVRTAGLSGTIAHIHEAPVGLSGGVRVDLVKVVTAPPNDLWVVGDTEPVLTPALVAAFNAGNLYFNVHTTTNPGGEIRGQINSATTVFTLGGGTAISGPTTPGTPQQPVVFPSSGVSFSNHVQLVFNTYCIACHATARTAAFLPLTLGASYTNLVNVPAVNPFIPGIRVIPSDSSNSVLYMRVSGVGLADPNQRMPLGGPFLDTLNPSAINAIKGWIDEGAQNN